METSKEGYAVFVLYMSVIDPKAIEAGIALYSFSENGSFEQELKICEDCLLMDAIKEPGEGYLLLATMDSDVFLYKTDDAGNVLKTTKLEDKFETGSMVKTKDGSTVISGGISRTNNQNIISFESMMQWDLRILKIDVNENVVFKKTYKSEKTDSASDIRTTNDGGYIIAGFQGTETRQLYAKRDGMSKEEQKQIEVEKKKHEEFAKKNIADFWVLKLDAEGNEEWSKVFSSDKHSGAVSALQTKDGGYIAVGITKAYGAKKEDIWLVKLDKSGNCEWEN